MLKYCDGCCKMRKDIRSMGRDSNGAPDAPDLCFICRVEAKKGRFFDRKQNRYVYNLDIPDYGDEDPFEELALLSLHAVGD